MTTGGGLHAPAAFLPQGWSQAVNLRWDAAGMLTAADPGPRDPTLPVASGPVIPGMPNLHSHAFQRALLGRVQRPQGADDFWSWRHLMYALVGRLTPGYLEAVSAQVFSEMVAAGYTSVVEFHYVHRVGGASPASCADAIVRAAKTAGIRLTLAPVLYRWGGLGDQPLGPQQQAFKLDHPEFQDLVAGLRSRGVQVALAPHSVRAANRPDLEFLLSLALPDTPVHIHVSEQPAEVQAALPALGATPIQWLHKEFGLDGRWGLVHGTHASNHELAMLDEGTGTLILCPTTEHDLGDGRFPLERTPRALVGIGSDSQVSISPLEELRLLLYGMRAAEGRRAVLPEGPFSDGAAMWRRCLEPGSVLTGQPVGRLDAGHAADFLVLDAARPLFFGLSPDEALSALVLSGQREDIAEVRIGGRVMARHGLHIQADDVHSEYRAALGRLFNPASP